MILALAVICAQLAVFAILLRNRATFRGLDHFSHLYGGDISSKISILIPARNEERVIADVVKAALNQDWNHLEVLVLDDRSTDHTSEILADIRADHPELRVIHGIERPQGWLGKPWACHQLSESATGDIFLFIDADTIPSPTLAKSVALEYSDQGMGLLTVWPQQVLMSFWERVLVPMVYYTLLSFLVTDYTRRDPRWMPPPFRNIFRPLFAAACGQCLAMPSQLYRDIGGHTLVKSDVVEDVGIARKVRSLGLPVRMYHGLGSISCRMYTSHKEIFAGFRKNFLAGFGGNVPVFVTSAVFHLLVYVLPPIACAISLLQGDFKAAIIWLIAVVIPIMHRMALHSWMRWDLWTSVTHTLGVVWFQLLGLVVLMDRLLGRKVAWKGRKL